MRHTRAHVLHVYGVYTHAPRSASSWLVKAVARRGVVDGEEASSDMLFQLLGPEFWSGKARSGRGTSTGDASTIYHKGTAASITKGESFSKFYMDGGVQHMTIFIVEGGEAAGQRNLLTDPEQVYDQTRLLYVGGRWHPQSIGCSILITPICPVPLPSMYKRRIFWNSI